MLNSGLRSLASQTAQVASLEYLDDVGEVILSLSQLSSSVCPLPVGRPDSVRILGTWTGWSCNGVMQPKVLTVFSVDARQSFIVYIPH